MSILMFLFAELQGFLVNASVLMVDLQVSYFVGVSWYVHWWKADLGTTVYLHPNMAACETCKFLSFNIHEKLFSCLIFY